MRVLLVEDDSATAQMIELMLKSEGFNVYTTDLGEEAVDLGKIYDYDIILLDLNLPDISGFDVVRSLRVAKIDTPIMIVSGNQTTDAIVKALNGGADDYLTKPFHKNEMVARIHAIVRRSKGHALSVIKTGGIVVNLDDKTVEVVNTRLHLTGKEYQMLELLALRKGSTLTKEMFLNHLYGGMDEPELKIIDVFICKLRKKISKANNGRHHIETVWGRGYVLRDPPAQAEAEPFANEEDPIPEPEPEAVNEDVSDSSEQPSAPNRYMHMTVNEKVACALIGQQPMSAKEILARVHQHIDPSMLCESQKASISKMKDRGLLASTGSKMYYKYALTPKGVEWIEKIDEADKKSLVA